MNLSLKHITVIYKPGLEREPENGDFKCLQVPQLSTKSLLRIVQNFMFANSLLRLPKLICCQVTYLLPVRENGMEVHPIDLDCKKGLKRIKRNETSVQANIILLAYKITRSSTLEKKWKYQNLFQRNAILSPGNLNYIQNHFSIYF